MSERTSRCCLFRLRSGTTYFVPQYQHLVCITLSGATLYCFTSGRGTSRKAKRHQVQRNTRLCVVSSLATRDARLIGHFLVGFHRKSTRPSPLLLWPLAQPQAEQSYSLNQKPRALEAYSRE